MYIVYKTNLDYLIPDIRLHVGDAGEQTRFSDSLIRTALTTSIKMLQRRWGNRYLVFSKDMVVDELPSGVMYETDYYSYYAEDPNLVSTVTYIVPSGNVYGNVAGVLDIIPSGLKDNDVFRNTKAAFLGPINGPISQEDEYPVILAASIVLRKSYLSSSADAFQSWQDGEFSFSNLGSHRALSELYKADTDALDSYFKKRLSGPLRSNFGKIII